jgi:hypothetical protein
MNGGGGVGAGGKDTRTAADWALEHWRAGFAPVPVPFMSKGIYGNGWQKIRYDDEAQIRRAFAGKANIGILMGEPSGGLIDTDLDRTEARAVGKLLLPETRTMGRAGTTHGHKLYFLDGPLPETKQFTIPGEGPDRMVLEVRSTGAQSLGPGSTYPLEKGQETPDVCVWGDGEIVRVSSDEYLGRVREAAISALLAMNYPGEGSRHKFCMGASGYLIPRVGIEETKRIIHAAASVAKDPEVKDRLKAVPTTVKRIRATKSYRGGPTLDGFSKEYSILDRLQIWFGFGKSEEDGLPDIMTSNRPLRAMREEALRVLEDANDPPVLFVRGDRIVRIGRDDSDHPAIQIVDEAKLSNRLSRVANFGRIEKGGEFRHMYPPEQVVKDILAEGRWKFSRLVSITQTPFLRPDGTIHSTPGYDPATGIYYDPGDGEVPEVSGNPTQGEVKRAAELIGEAIGDFPFDSKASRTNMFALLLTPVLRAAIPGPVPIAAIDKPQAGTGASLLAEMVSLIATGSPAKMNPVPKAEEEMRKLLTTLIGGGESVIAFDNLDGELNSASLALALTAPVWRDRMLGRNQEIAAVQRATWICTGNNVQIGGDLPRRTYLIRLDAKMSKPYERDPSRFKHPELMNWVSGRRGDLVAALLTLGRSWFVEGCPGLEKAPIVGGFEGWIRVVGGVIENTSSKHFPSSAFLGNRTEFYDKSDPTSKEWDGFLEEWFLVYGNTPKRVREVISDLRELSEKRFDDLRDLLPGELSEKVEGYGDPSKSFGRMLSAREGRRHGPLGLYLSRHGAKSKHLRWVVKPTTSDNTDSAEPGGGFGGFGGFDDPNAGIDDTSQHSDAKRSQYLYDGEKPSKPSKPSSGPGVEASENREESVRRLVREGMSERIAWKTVRGCELDCECAECRR